ncbi:hypothetical protein F183_A11390 [Bryobacterales bacterium F-183]|nr:hypothetical protein F183_A11390 [Bryobacterales bacterium F-183]
MPAAVQNIRNIPLYQQAYAAFRQMFARGDLRLQTLPTIFKMTFHEDDAQEIHRFTGPRLASGIASQATAKDGGYYGALTLNGQLAPRGGVPLQKNVYRFRREIAFCDITSTQNRFALDTVCQHLAGKGVVEAILDPQDHTWSRAFHDALVDSPESAHVEAIVWQQPHQPLQIVILCAQPYTTAAATGFPAGSPHLQTNPA